MGNIAITAFMRSDEHYIIKTNGESVDLTQLWQDALTPDAIETAIKSGQSAAYLSFADLTRWLELTLSADNRQASREEYLAQLNSRVRDVLAAISFLEYVALYKALPALPPEVAKLHVPIVPDNPVHCKDCNREISVLCEECLQPWPCSTAAIPADHVSRHAQGIPDSQSEHFEWRGDNG